MKLLLSLMTFGFFFSIITEQTLGQTNSTLNVSINYRDDVNNIQVNHHKRCRARPVIKLNGEYGSVYSTSTFEKHTKQVIDMYLEQCQAKRERYLSPKDFPPEIHHSLSKAMFTRLKYMK